MTEESQMAGGMGDSQIAELRRKVADRVDGALECLPSIQETMKLIENNELEIGFPLDDSIEALRQEKEQLQHEITEASRVLDLQLEIVTGLHRQQNSLQQILTKYKRKSAARLEAAVALGKRNRNDNDVEMVHFQCETESVAEKKISVGVQCFEFMNEIGEDVFKVREQEKEFAKTVEEAFKLLLVGRYTANSQNTNTKPNKGEPASAKKTQNPPKLASSKNAVELNIDSGVEDDGSIIFDGNLSPTFSEKEATDEKKRRSKRTREKYK